MFEIRDRALENLQEQHAFNTAYSPVLENLIDARRAYRQSCGAPDSMGLAGKPVPDASFDTLADRALLAVPKIFEFFQLPISFLFEPDAAFNEGVASLYAHDPIVATYLLGCHSDWLKKWIDARQGVLSGDAGSGSSASMSASLGRIAALVENVCVHLFSKSLAKLTKSLVIAEIPVGKRNPEYQRRFEIVLAADGVTPWILEYSNRPSASDIE